MFPNPVPAIPAPKARSPAMNGQHANAAGADRAAGRVAQTLALLAAGLGAIWAGPACGDDAARALQVQATKGAEVRLVPSAEGTCCEISSAEGIGHFTLANSAADWPSPLVLRLRLKGMESLTLAAGPRRLHVSLTSSSPHRLLVEYTRDTPDPDGQDGAGGSSAPAAQAIAADSALWPQVQVMDRHGRAVQLRLPPEGGWIEITVPSKLLGDASSLQVAWVDFHRG